MKKLICASILALELLGATANNARACEFSFGGSFSFSGLCSSCGYGPSCGCGPCSLGLGLGVKLWANMGCGCGPSCCVPCGGPCCYPPPCPYNSGLYGAPPAYGYGAPVGFYAGGEGYGY